jgi:hypothetical protein
MVKNINYICTKENIGTLLTKLQYLSYNYNIKTLISGKSTYQILEKSIRSLVEPEIKEDSSIAIECKNNKLLTQNSLYFNIFRWSDFLFLLFNENEDSASASFYFDGFFLSVSKDKNNSRIDILKSDLSKKNYKKQIELWKKNDLFEVS